jgi:hypothetical protein
VLFKPGAFVQADGELRIAGLPADSVYLLPLDTSGAPGTRWGGLKLSLQDATQISYCVMRGSSYGIRLSESSPLVEFCTIADNGDTTANGGGIYLENSGARIAGCVIEANRARYGGGIYILNSIPRITNCIIRNNSAVAGGGAYLRFLVGALFQSNLIYDNQGGGLAIIEHSAPRLINNTIVDNTGTGVFAGVRSMPVLVNNIIWGNSDSSISVDAYAHALVSFCDVQGRSEGTLNLDTDPSFDPASPLPYMLADGSPLIDKGNPELSHRDYYFPPSQGTARSDIGAYGGPLSGNWESAALEMTVFQNPAFPHWLDIYLLSQESLTQAPLCSLQVGSGAMVAIELVPLGTMVYRGAYEATSGGAVFITADAELAGGHKKVGRIFQLLLTDPAGGGGYLRMVGVDGGLTFDAGALDGQTALLAGVEPKPLQPEGQLLFLSPEFFVSGITGRLVEPGRLRLSLPGVEDWSREQLSHLGIYYRENSGWIRLEGGFRDGAIVAGVDHSGGFAIAWNEQVPSESDPPVPDAIELIAAYPNPFNGAVSIVFDLSESADIKLTVFDLAGRETIHLAQGTFPAGEHRLVWSARDADGISLPSGIYWVRLNTGRGNRTIKLLLLR